MFKRPFKRAITRLKISSCSGFGGGLRKPPWATVTKNYWAAEGEVIIAYKNLTVRMKYSLGIRTLFK
jgi:hypothetical protein